MKDWDKLNEQGQIVDFDGTIPELPLLKPVHLSPQKRMKLADNTELESEIKLEKELEIESLLPLCRRLRHQDNDTGGFFVAMLMHKKMPLLKVLHEHSSTNGHCHQNLLGNQNC